MQSFPSSIFPSLEPRNQRMEEDVLARESDVTVSNITLYAEYQGFFIYVLSGIVLTCWIGWCVIPDDILRDYFSIYYYPNKYWSHAIPAWSLILMLYIYIALALYNTEIKTLKLDDVRCFVDENSVIPGSLQQTREEQLAKNAEYVWKAPSGVWDLPITLVNEVLYEDTD